MKKIFGVMLVLSFFTVNSWGATQDFKGSVTGSGGTLTVDETAALSSKAPKANPSFTGNVHGIEANYGFSSMNPTNTAVNHVGHAQTVSMADNQTFTVIMATHGYIVTLYENASGKGGAFFLTYASATIIELGDPDGYFAITDSDAGGWAIYKGANSQTFTIKNYTNSTNAICVNILGQVISATAPTGP